jgi:large subunit ribosomal protein L25
LKVAPRESFGTRESRRLRKEGLVPGVVYSDGGDARPFQVVERDVRNLISEGQALFDLEIEGQKAVPVVVKEQQLHPVRDQLIHIDFHQVSLDTAITAMVPVELEGTTDAPGVKEGGVLEHVTREVEVEALPTEIPEVLIADVSEMDIGDTLPLTAVVAPEGVKFTAEELEDVTIATLSPPRVEEEPEVEEEVLVGEDGEPIEPVEGEEGEEAAEGEEGEAPAEGESSSDDDGE